MTESKLRAIRTAALGRHLLLGALVAIAACGPADAGTADDTPGLQGGTATLEELGATIWSALIVEDTAVLESLRLTRAEHDELVWPEQPAAREPSASANLDLWWSNIETRNRAALADLGRTFRGSTARLAGTRCSGEPRQYSTYQALTDCQLTLELEDGSERRVQAFRYAILMDGRLKVVRYYSE